MRSLIATIVLCCLMFLAATANFIYINHIANILDEMTDDLPDINEPSCVEKTDAICQEWEKHAPFVGLTVGFLTIDKFSEHCETLRSCAQVGDVYGYHSTLTLLKDSIDDMRRLEQLEIENLF